MPRKRAPLPFDTEYFKKQSQKGERKPIDETFNSIYQTNHWGGADSVSGNGSGQSQTDEIRKQLPLLMDEFGLTSILDLPCGDFNWMRQVNFGNIRYTGADIVVDIIHKNQKTFADKNRQFIALDLTRDNLPPADIIFSRDCLVHLSFEDIFRALKNLKRSTIPYLLTTTFPDCEENIDIVSGDWRILNLEKPPFHFPKPLRLINERCTEGDGTYADKSLGLWEIQSLL